MPNATNTRIDAVSRDIEDLAACADSQIKAALSIIDAVCVLSALERTPEHHDTHPSHNIKTGGGFAHGRKLHDDTLPILLEHAHFLVSSADNDYDVMREMALRALKGGVA